MGCVVDGTKCTAVMERWSGDGPRTSADASLEGGVNFVGDSMPLGIALEDGKWGTGGYPGARAPFARALSIFSLLVSLNMDLARLGVPFNGDAQ